MSALREEGYLKALALQALAPAVFSYQGEYGWSWTLVLVLGQVLNWQVLVRFQVCCLFISRWLASRCFEIWALCRNIWPWHIRTLKIAPCILELGVIGLETLEVGKLGLGHVSIILCSMETTGGGVAHLDTKVGYLQNPAYPQVTGAHCNTNRAKLKNWNDTPTQEDTGALMQMVQLVPATDSVCQLRWSIFAPKCAINIVQQG